MGRAERRELASRPRVLLAHLLRWTRRPDKRSGSRKATMLEQRSAWLDHLADNPILAAQRDGFVAQVYGSALRQTAAATGIAEAHFPASCPWSVDDVLDDGFWPD